MSAFLEEAIDFEEFDERIDYGTRFLENVVTMSDFPVEKIEQKVRDMRKIGLGVMGLAQLYIQLGIQYGTEPGNEVARQLMTHINHASKRLPRARDGARGRSTTGRSRSTRTPPSTATGSSTIPGSTRTSGEDGFPIRNHNTTTIAPTGTTSMIGNTTGGCEPIYNVAYYKNVSDDVQGDEMLVEFDDYFLRTLEENDVDVDAAKQGGPRADGDERVRRRRRARDGSGRDRRVVRRHRRPLGQAARVGPVRLPGGRDSSAISKTCNFPNDATAEEMEEVYRYIYDHGGKGVTVYRDGTRSKQVLTTRAKNAEFRRRERGRPRRSSSRSAKCSAASRRSSTTRTSSRRSTRRFRISSKPPSSLGSTTASAARAPTPLNGVTQRVETGYGKLYVTINEDENGLPFELFANIGHLAATPNSFTEALAKVISTALRSGVDPGRSTSYRGYRSPKSRVGQRRADPVDPGRDRHRASALPRRRCR